MLTMFSNKKKKTQTISAPFAPLSLPPPTASTHHPQNNIGTFEFDAYE